MASASQPAIAASVQDLLGLHGSWDQAIKVTMPGRGGATVILGQGSRLPVALYEFEVVACVHDATEESGLKWWLRTSNRSRAKQNQVESSWGTISFVCPHYRKGYDKQRYIAFNEREKACTCSSPSNQPHAQPSSPYRFRKGVSRR